MSNTLAYYDADLITAFLGFIVLAPGFSLGITDALKLS
jgi:hypothetical protein